MRITDVSKLKGPLGEVCDQLFGENGEERLAELNLWLKKVTVILKHVRFVAVPAIGRFVARDHLSAVNIGWTGENFKKFFLNEVEKDVLAGEGEIVISKLQKPSLDVLILKELGDRAETSLAQFFALIKKQARGQSGGLLVNGYANIAYIRSKKDNKLWAVNAYWYDFSRRWDVEAYSVEVPDGWCAGDQVLSRK